MFIFYLFNKMDTWPHFSITKQKLKLDETKRTNSFLHSYKKGNFFLKCGTIARNAPP